jgi:hypothetical protein
MTSRHSKSRLSFKNNGTYTRFNNTYREHHKNLEICEQKILNDLEYKLSNNELDSTLEYFNTTTEISDDNSVYKNENIFYDLSHSMDMKFFHKITPLAYLNKPLISLDETGKKIFRHYLEIDTGDTILIWGIKNEREIYHVSAQIITKANNFYSFGFSGNIVVENKRGVLFGQHLSQIITPDFILERKMIKHLFNNKNEKHVKLIAASKLIEDDKIKIYSLFDKLVNANDVSCLNQTFKLNKELFPKDINTSKHNTKINTEILLKLEYLLKNGHKQRKPILSGIKTLIENEKKHVERNLDSKIFNSVYYYYNNPDINYCLLSSKRNTTRKSGKKANCTSFMLYLFDDILKCNGFGSFLVANPKHCMQRERSQVLHCDNDNLSSTSNV